MFFAKYTTGMIPIDDYSHKLDGVRRDSDEKCQHV